MLSQNSFTSSVLALLVTFGCVGATGATEPPRPNILFICADDLGFGDLASFGHPRIKTPNLDRLAAQGTRFTQFYASHSVCSPTRASFITGQFPSRWRMYGHLGWLRDNAKRGMPDWLELRAPSVPRALQRAGYHTAILGKWHLGGGSGREFAGRAINSADAPPVTAYGFDEARVFFGNGPTWKGTKPVNAPHQLYPYADQPLVQWSSRLLADAAIEYLERHVQRPNRPPFLLNVSLHDPHVPLAPTDEMLSAYADVADPGIRAYYAVVTHMDFQIGRILERLDELGLRDTTLVIFTSDNGAAARQGSQDTGRPAGLALDTDTAGSNGPLRGWKWHLYEGGIRVPMIARWPGVIPADRTDATSVLSICDFAPTFLQLAGAAGEAGGEFDGVDVLPALRGEPFTRSQPLLWQNPTANRRGPTHAIRDGKWKLLMESDGTEPELFDLERDSAERINLAGEHPLIVQSLQRKLRAWTRSLPTPLD